MAEGESAVVAVLPEVEPLVDAWRQRLDPAAAQGIPAHITVLWPFVPAAELTAPVIDRLAAAVAGAGVVRFSLVSVEAFPDSVWLRPEPADGLVDLTRRVWAAFPDCPPYAGQFPDIVPHVTVAVTDEHSQPRLLPAITRQLAASLPVACAVDRLGLWTCGADQRWRPRVELLLAP